MRSGGVVLVEGVAELPREVATIRGCGGLRVDRLETLWRPRSGGVFYPAVARLGVRALGHMGCKSASRVERALGASSSIFRVDLEKIVTSLGPLPAPLACEATFGWSNPMAGWGLVVLGAMD